MDLDIRQVQSWYVLVASKSARAPGGHISGIRPDGDIARDGQIFLQLVRPATRSGAASFLAVDNTYPYDMLTHHNTKVRYDSRTRERGGGQSTGRSS